MLYSFKFKFFMGLLRMWMSGFLLPVLLLRLFSSFYFALSSLDSIVFVYIIIFYCCHVWLWSRRSLFFTNERQKGSESREKGHGEQQWGIKGWETLIVICCMEKESECIIWKKSIFNKRYKKGLINWMKILEVFFAIDVKVACC